MYIYQLIFLVFCAMCFVVRRPHKAERGIWKCRASVHQSVRPRYVVRFLFVDQLISNLLTHKHILGISSLSSKIGHKIVRMVAIFKMSAKAHKNFKVLQFQRKLIFSDKCDLKMAVAIFNMVAKTHKKFRSGPMLQLQRKLIFRGFQRNVIVTNAISKLRSFWQPFLRWPPKCVKFRSAPFQRKLICRVFPT